MCNSRPSLLHFCNINSYPNKKKQIKVCLSNSPQSSILALCETKLSPDYPHSLKIPGYGEPFNFPYTSHSSGLMVYVKSTLISRQVSNLSLSIEGNMCAFVDVVLFPALTVRVGVVYVKPNAPLTVLLQILDRFKQAMVGKKPILLLGDFNC